jgi:hypothetical protein
MGEFDPYLEWKALTPEMARELALAIKAYRLGADALVELPTPKRAARVVKAQRDINDIYDAIEHSILVVPSMVHVAGEKQTTMTDEGQEEITQRCVRCKSVLGYWRDDLIYMTPHGPQPVPEAEVPWWNEGSTVAKATPEGLPMQFYEVPGDRELFPYEHECVGMPDLEIEEPS